MSDYKVLANAFLASLRSVGVFDAMLPSMVRLPFRTNIVVSVLAVTGHDIGEAETKPVSDLSFGADKLDFQKAAGIVVVSEELLRFASVEGAIENGLRDSVVAAVDAGFITKLTAASTPIASSGDVLEDLATLFSAVERGSASSWYFVIPVAAAAQIATMPAAVGGVAFPGMSPKGGVISGVPVLVSDQLTNTAILADASQIAAAAEGISLEVVAHGSLDMNPGNSPEGPLLSLWQKNLRAIRAERWWDVTVLRDSAVASLSGVGYSGGSPA